MNILEKCALLHAGKQLKYSMNILAEQLLPKFTKKMYLDH